MKRGKQIRVALLSTALLIVQFRAAAYAEIGPSNAAGGLCEHHLAHTAECGYRETVESQSCGYVCDKCSQNNMDSGGAGSTSGNDLPESADAAVVAVTAFDELDDTVKYQIVELGTKLDRLILPATLGASGGTESVREPITIDGVTWESDSACNETAEQGSYLFTPVLPVGYVLADDTVKLPDINMLIDGTDAPFDTQHNILTVTFDSNGTGYSEMKTALDAACATLTSDDKKTITTIKLIGNATEITDLNWRDLTDQYIIYSGLDNLTSLDLSGMTSLKAIRPNIPYGYLERIKLKMVTFPDSLTEIGNYAFKECTSLALQELPADLTKIGVQAFYDCTSLALQKLPAGVTEIGDSAFYGCTSLDLKELSAGLSTIGDSAFRSCTSLALQELPSGLTKIGNSAFRDCTSLALQELPAGLSTIGDSAFYGCTSLESLLIPASVKNIGTHAFQECMKLNKVTFEGKTAPTFGSGIFDNITPLPTIDVPKGATGYPIDWNEKTDVLSVIFDNNGTGGTSDSANEMKTALDAALDVFTSGNKKTVTTIKLVGSVREITNWNWKYLIDQYNRNNGWDSLTTLDLSGMTSLKAIRPNIPYGYLERIKLKTLFIPDSLTEIGNSAFRGCTNLALQELPAGLTKIGDSAFEGCTSLALQKLPAGLTRIGDSAFKYCTSLALQELPVGLTKIGDSVFEDCPSLALQELPAGLTETGAWAFRGCTSLTLQELPAGLTEIGMGTFYNCTSLALQKLPAGLTEIDEWVFFYCTNLGLQELPAGLSTIGDSAFEGCTSLALKELPAGLIAIGDSAFEYCTSLADIIMEPTTAPALSNSAFNATRPVLKFYVPKDGTGYDSGGWERLHTVEYSPITSFILKPATLELQPNKVAALTAVLEPTDATFTEICWKSSNTNVATVDNTGKVTAIAEGTATITSSSRQGGKMAACAVTVRLIGMDAVQH